MLFQWNIAQWLSLPDYPVEPTLTINTGKNTYDSRADAPVILGANESSFDIRLHYQSKDNLPRYVNASLRKRIAKVSLSKGLFPHDTELPIPEPLHG